MSTTTPNFHIEKIVCPNCDYIQEAKVLHTIPFGTYIHHCEKCNYTIMESEWNKYEPTTPTKEVSAMQELIEYFRYFPEIVRKAKSLLPKEREQIVDAYNEDLYGGLEGRRQYNDGTDYFNSKYNVL